MPLAQVEVLLVNAGSNVIQDKAYSDETGGFRFFIKPGVFNLGTFKAGYASQLGKRYRGMGNGRIHSDRADARSLRRRA